MADEKKKCKHCQEEIDAKAKRCPKCQGDLRSWPARHPILTAILALFIIGMGIGAVSGGGSETSKPEVKTETEVTSTKVVEEGAPAPMQIKVTELADEFDENQVAAEAKWEGKLVEFAAEISNITDSGVSFHNVSSKEFSFTQISCRIADKNQLLSLKNGELVTVQGTVGKQSLGVIDIKDCKVVE